jgi:hypothetical protein
MPCPNAESRGGRREERESEAHRTRRMGLDPPPTRTIGSGTGAIVETARVDHGLTVSRLRRLFRECNSSIIACLYAGRVHANALCAKSGLPFNSSIASDLRLHKKERFYRECRDTSTSQPAVTWRLETMERESHHAFVCAYLGCAEGAGEQFSCGDLRTLATYKSLRPLTGLCLTKP